MITKYRAVITFGFTLGVLLGSQMCGDRLRSAVSRSFTENASELGSQKSAGSDRSGEALNSDGTMYGVTLRGTHVYDSQGLQEPKLLQVIYFFWELAMVAFTLSTVVIGRRSGK